MFAGMEIQGEEEKKKANPPPTGSTLFRYFSALHLLLPCGKFCVFCEVCVYNDMYRMKLPVVIYFLMLSVVCVGALCCVCFWVCARNATLIQQRHDAQH
jgi:hypothetical protein